MGDVLVANGIEQSRVAVVQEQLTGLCQEGVLVLQPAVQERFRASTEIGHPRE